MHACRDPHLAAGGWWGRYTREVNRRRGCPRHHPCCWPAASSATHSTSLHRNHTGRGPWSSRRLIALYACRTSPHEPARSEESIQDVQFQGTERDTHGGRKGVRWAAAAMESSERRRVFAGISTSIDIRPAKGEFVQGGVSHTEVLESGISVKIQNQARLPLKTVHFGPCFFAMSTMSAVIRTSWPAPRCAEIVFLGAQLT